MSMEMQVTMLAEPTMGQPCVADSHARRERFDRLELADFGAIREWTNQKGL